MSAWPDPSSASEGPPPPPSGEVWRDGGRPRRAAGLAAALILLGIGGAAVSCTQQSNQAQAQRAPVPVRVAPVSRGDISGVLSYTGELQAVDQVSLLPSAGGRIVDVFVDEGAEVKAGGKLAQLETDILEAQVRQAEANVASAQARLDTVLQGARPEEIAASRAALDAVRNKLQGMMDGSRPEEVTAAEAARNAAQAALSTATANLASAEAKLRQLQKPTREDLGTAQASSSAAEGALTSARQKLEQLRNPAQSDIEAAQAGLDAANAALKSAQAKLDDLRAMPKPADVAAAQATLNAAQASLRSAESNFAALKEPLNTEKLKTLIDAYTGVKLARDRLAMDRAQGAPASVIAADEDALNLAYRRLQVAEEDVGTFTIGVTAEQILAGQASVDSAQAAVRSAQQRLDLVLAGPTAADLQSGQSAVDSARANVDTARIKLERLKNPPSADIAVAEAAVDQADAAAVAAQNKFQVLQNPTEADLRAAQAAVETARGARETAASGLAAAESNLAKAREPFREPDIAAQRAQLEQTAQQVALTESRFTRADIAGATAGVALAQAALELTRIQLSKATLVAPFDAIVARKLLSKGAFASAQSPVFTLVSQELQIAVSVEEGAIGRLRPGLPVTFTVAAFGDRAFQGEVTGVSPVADAASRTFRILVRPANPSGLRAGMFTALAVAVDQRQGVLQVPQEALVQQGNESFVYVVVDGQAERKKVEVGIGNDRFTQVRAGVEEGEEVVVRGNRTLRPGDKVQVVR